MAEMVTIEGQQYMKRNPLGVLGLSVITLGIYFFVWYYKINVEIQRLENDPTMSPTRSLMAMIFGWLIIAPPFIAMYNTAKHVQAMETRLGVQQTLERRDRGALREASCLLKLVQGRHPAVDQRQDK